MKILNNIQTLLSLEVVVILTTTVTLMCSSHQYTTFSLEGYVSSKHKSSTTIKGQCAGA